MIDDNILLYWDENGCNVEGTIKNVSDPWTAFSSSVEEQTGHFFPMKFSDEYKKTSVTVKNRVAGDRTFTLDDDCILIQRIENLKENKATIVLTDMTFTLDFSKATLSQ